MQNAFYVRTAEGQAAAYDATSAMPRKLKSLLKVIDGKTSQDVFESSLKAFGDVQGLLKSLEKARLIELTQSAYEPTAQTVAQAQPIAQPEPAKASFVSNFANKIGLRSNRTQGNAEGSTPSQTMQSQPQTILVARPSEADQEQERQQDLQLLVQDMSSFVLAYVPEQAFGVLSELEAINTMEQMAVLLGGYELIVRHVGEPARIHLKHVQHVVGKWL